MKLKLQGPSLSHPLLNNVPNFIFLDFSLKGASKCYDLPASQNLNLYFCSFHYFNHKASTVVPVLVKKK